MTGVLVALILSAVLWALMSLAAIAAVIYL